MKRIFLLNLLIVLTQLVIAQKVDVSISAGGAYNKSEIRKYGVYQKETQMLDAFNSYNIGIRIAAHISKRIDFRTGVFISEKGYRYNEKLYDGGSPYNSLQPYQSSHTYFLNYADIPFMFSYRFTKHFSVNAGTSLSLLLNRAKIISTSKFDVPLLGGFTFTKNRFTIDLTYSHGQMPYLTKYYEYLNGTRDYYEYFHKQISLNLGYCINKKIEGCLSCKQKGF
jgi:hypothetical protein